MSYVEYKDEKYGVEEDFLDLGLLGIEDISEIKGLKSWNNKFIWEKIY